MTSLLTLSTVHNNVFVQRPNRYSFWTNDKKI